VSFAYLTADSRKLTGTVERSEAARKEAEEEYVYDLYYRDVRDSSIALGVRAGDGTSATSIGAL
jgi:hypothetical protein